MESLTIYAWLAVFATFGSYVKSAEHDCQLFTVSSCDYKDQEIILPFDLPPFSEEQCQDFCQTYTGCLHYKHTTNKTTEETLCQLFTTDYVQECDIVGGTLNTTLEECLSNDFDANSCDNWVHEDCVYPEEAIFIPYQPGDIRDEKHCQSSCHDLAVLGCKYWVYGSRQSLCTLYKQFDVYPTCSAINGPESPHRKDCIKDTSEVCVRMITGTEPDSLEHPQGDLKVTIDGDVIADSFEKGAMVIDACHEDLVSLTVTCPSGDGWDGTVEVTVDGERKPINCKDCTGSSVLIDGNIGVDGNSDNKFASKTHCFNGASCTLTWE